MSHSDILLPVVAQPGLIDGARLPSPFRLVGPGHPRPVGLIAADDQGLRRLMAETASPLVRALPVLGLGANLRSADRVGDDPDDVRLLGPLCRRALELPFGDNAHRCFDLAAYLLIRDSRLEPTVDFTSPDLFSYGIEDRMADVREAAESLADDGFLTRSLFEKTNHCPDCASARVLIREQCRACGSPAVSDAVILHHFICAHQAPEDDFKVRDDLVCPKCRQTLRHPSIDYERSTTVTCCEACGDVADEPDVGYRCLDCGSRNVAAKLNERVVAAYALTAKARRLLREPAAAEEAARVRLPVAQHVAAG